MEAKPAGSIAFGNDGQWLVEEVLHLRWPLTADFHTEDPEQWEKISEEPEGPFLPFAKADRGPAVPPKISVSS